jgi:hypothetical protein
MPGWDKPAEITSSLGQKGAPRVRQGLSLLCLPVTYMRCGAHHVGYMFLGEVVLGKEHHITTDEPSLKCPPPGFNSVIARGKTEPGESWEAGQP